MPGAAIAVAEPHVEVLPRSLAGLDNVQLTSTEDAIRDADIVLLLVDHDAFKQLDRSVLEGKDTIDTRGIWR